MPHSPLTDKNPTHYLKRFGRDVHPSQFLRELVQNAIEAEATKIDILNEPILAKKDILKLCVRDNGKGMTAREMYQHLGSMNSSSKSSNSDPHENYGIGAKVTTAHNNPYGVVFMSWTKGNPVGNLVWLSLENDRFGMKSFPITDEFEDEDGEVFTETTDIVSYIDGKATNVIPLYHEDYGNFTWEGVNWNKHKPRCGHGSVVVLMGKSLEDNSWTDAEGKLYSARGVSHYLNQRYAYIPKDTRIKVLRGKGKLQLWVMGLLATFRAPGFLKSQSFVECPDGFKVEVLITEKHSTWREKQGKESRKQFGGSSPLLSFFEVKDIEKGFVAVQYKSEKTTELYNIQRGINTARDWGLSCESVIPNVKLIVHPPQLDDTNQTKGVYPNEGRDQLLWRDYGSLKGSGRKLDLSKVREHFINNMPQELRSLIDNAYEGYQGKQLDITKVVDRWKSIFKSRNNLDAVIESHAKGDINFDPTGMGGTKEYDKKEVEDSKGGVRKGLESGGHGHTGDEENKKGKIKGRKRKTKKQKDIIIRWETKRDIGFESTKTEEKFLFFAVEDTDRIVVTGNPNHDLIKEVLAFFVVENKKVPKVFIHETIKEVYEGELQSYILHLLNFNKKKGSSVTPYLTHETLQSKFMGCHMLWGKISRKINNRFR